MYWGWKYSAPSCAINFSIKYSFISKTPQFFGIFSNAKSRNNLCFEKIEGLENCDGVSRGDQSYTLISKENFDEASSFRYFAHTRRTLKQAQSAISALFAPVFGDRTSAVYPYMAEKWRQIPDLVASPAHLALLKQQANRNFIRSLVDIIGGTTNGFTRSFQGSPRFFSGRSQ